jgi:uncharacterized protein (DUF1810 family)
VLAGREARAPYHQDVDYDLDRFLRKQETWYAIALRELQAGQKREHWMWWIFPQLRGLGKTEDSWTFGITSLDEARAYADHPLLGVRLRECAGALLACEKPVEDLFPEEIDVMKLRSSMTLFHVATGDDTFQQVLEKYFGGVPDRRTVVMVDKGLGLP